MIISFSTGLAVVGSTVDIYCNINDLGVDRPEISMTEEKSRPGPGWRVVTFQRVLDKKLASLYRKCVHQVLEVRLETNSDRR